jgi:hypothetical protein
MSKPSSGDVWHYDYLWRWQQDKGETEGRKSRPITFVAVVTDKAGITNLFILPITSTPPELAMEVPQIERRRAGLGDKPLWVMLDEYNYDRLETSFYFEPGARIGRFSGAFHQKTLRAFVSAAKERRTKRVSRTK